MGEGLAAMENLVTTRLYLVPFKLEIVKAAIMGDAELASVLGITVLPNWADEEFGQGLPIIADILRLNPLQSEWGWGSLIIHKAEKTLIGHVSLKIIPDATGNATGSLEIGYHIAPSYRQQGYASEAAKAMVDWAFCQPGVQSVTAGCDADNSVREFSRQEFGAARVVLFGSMLNTSCASNTR